MSVLLFLHFHVIHDTLCTCGSLFKHIQFPLGSRMNIRASIRTISFHLNSHVSKGEGREHEQCMKHEALAYIFILYISFSLTLFLYSFSIFFLLLHEKNFPSFILLLFSFAFKQPNKMQTKSAKQCNLIEFKFLELDLWEGTTFFFVLLFWEVIPWILPSKATCNIIISTSWISKIAVN